MTDTNIDEAIKSGVQAHQAGNIIEAERHYTSIIAQQPKHPDANHNMGILTMGLGQAEKSLPFFETALAANPSVEQFWLSYITALLTTGQRDVAKENINKAKLANLSDTTVDKLENLLSKATDILPLDPPQEDIDQLFSFYNDQKFNEIIPKAEKVISQYPNHLMTWNVLGAANQALGILERAEEAFKKVTEIDPSYPDGFNNLGVAQQELKKTDEAILAFNKAINLRPEYAQAHYNLGIAYQEKAELTQAIAHFEKAILLKPDYTDAYNNMGNALKDQERLDEALNAYQKAIEIQPNSILALNNLGNTLQDQGKLDEAIKCYQEILSLAPDDFKAYNNLGNALRDQGELNDALKAFSKAIELKEDYAPSHRNLSVLLTYTQDDPQIALVNNLLVQSDMKSEDRCHLHYAFAKMNEDLGNLKVAFESYVKGGGLRKQILGYRLEQDEFLFREIKASQSSLFKASVQQPDPRHVITPIFILGMPRSGTTLVEQILSSHSKVQGGGELIFVERYGFQLCHGAQSATREHVEVFRNTYLEALEALSDGRQFITDKMPSNFRYIALIRSALPEAKIIHTMRDPVATCWSNFKHYFSSNGLGYSYELEDTVKYFKLYEDLMKYWEGIYSDQIYNLDYETLTIDQEEETRKVLSFIGLDWDKNCLLPHKNTRSVRTASQQQVRKKIYTGSSNDWRKFEPFLQGALNEVLVN